MNKFEEFKEQIIKICHQAIASKRTTGIASNEDYVYVAEKIATKDGKSAIIVISAADIKKEIKPADTRSCMIIFFNQKGE